ncbi:unnamed protein product [Effrenium voratum]|uniref:PRA1 family protein n=1 Tax=Effrenium voratum TaxID=2562239 RepID=A0AA36MIQ9_9DINO|nr:unnamed protein product [Effrenium voratum]CAJ1373141.1 unnamed protein product [Effrenium voratum]CAJ1426083.1 unnamed protein product [Effrenium voratum]|mmetsp:Transcript_4114/g.9905  ORF Transcript_4114/g.9905 Transcript_4114/m.9905 type:complete len:247 (-) Transcript_4114:86-826(-)|eukprot:CAMPEP_0181437278 /NCGR_PEP_ID=MMETSP1110-20121109/21293_1 /TAXON_ID=174948 /ORGANISM="Symbiodinium sp., Strain CCMP421" /LENGTH=246 /DNA_ID=CAMNT_0023560893 /DNA_START=47 /DNA_END=787 /DNA_ORIENTATION=+
MEADFGELDAELEGFFNGTTSTVNLQPHPTSFGSEEKTSTSAPKAPQAEPVSGFRASMAGLLGRAAVLQGVMSLLGQAEGAGASPIPSSVGSVKDQATSFLSKAQPWREFVWPLSVPTANEGCSRLSANVFNYQTNYAILFVVQLILSILTQPSALMCIILTVITWVLFLKKNEDPDWAPKLGGVVLSPMQRWLLLAAVTAIVLLLWVGGPIFNAALMYLFFFLAHGLLHEPPRGVAAGVGDPVPI